MCGIACGVTTTVIGAIAVVASCVIGYVVVPNVIENIIIGETVLEDGTIQMERFETVPFPLNFTVRIFNLSNSQEVLEGAVPIMEELGPYVYKLRQSREILDKEEDIVRYIRHENFEFDYEASYPNREDDMVTIVNVPYHAIIQVAERFYPALAGVLNLAMTGIFREYNSPVMTVRVRELLFDGVPICADPGVIGGIACNIIREIAQGAQNLAEQEDGSLLFSVLSYKEDFPSSEYEVFRGLKDPRQLGQIISFNKSLNFTYWTNDLISAGGGQVAEQLSVCNMINGTDAGIFAPLIDTRKDMYAINTDICRSVKLRFEGYTENNGIPTVRFAANEWLLDNDDGCFCLNVTTGINRPDGCLLEGAMELYSCVGAFLVLSYPHFLFANDIYRNGVFGMDPVEDRHKIMLDIEPNTGTPVRGYKRAQFNIFSRRVSGISATNNLRTALVPFLWIEEGISLPEEFVDELTTRLLNRLRLVDILIPIIVAVTVVILVLGVLVTIWACRRKPNVQLVNGVRS